jgi:hypothetical protein
MDAIMLYRRGEELRLSAPGVWIYTFVLFGLTIVVVLARISARVYYKHFGLGEQETDTIDASHRHLKLTTYPDDAVIILALVRYPDDCNSPFLCSLRTNLSQISTIIYVSVFCACLYTLIYP